MGFFLYLCHVLLSGNFESITHVTYTVCTYATSQERHRVCWLISVDIAGRVYPCDFFGRQGGCRGRALFATITEIVCVAVLTSMGDGHFTGTV